MQLRMISMSVIAAISIAACGGKAKGPEGGGGTEATASLYDRLGKKDAITAVVKDFVEERVAKDDRINKFFLNTDIPNLEAKLVEQICAASGGPCTYTGKDMKTVHAGLNIKDADFNALVEDLKASLDHFKVGAKEQQELLGALAPMHDDIVTAK
jgi:hemoglobin